MSTATKRQKLTMTVSDPIASYVSPSCSKQFSTSDHPESHHTTNGRTTGPSQFVLDAGAVDKDMPSEPKDTYLGGLRAKVTTLQDDLNEFLTERMQLESSNSIVKDANSDNSKTQQQEEEFEKKLLDGADEDSEDED